MKKNQSTSPQVFIILTAMALLVTACGEKPQQPPVPQTTPALTNPAPPLSTKLFQEQRSALDKAKGVEQTIEKSSEESKQEMDRQAQ